MTAIETPKRGRAGTAAALSIVAGVAVAAAGCTAGQGDRGIAVADDPGSTVGLATVGMCSGAIVAPPRARAADAALFLTNGHCDTTGSVLGRANTDRTTNVSAVVSTGPDTPAIAVAATKRLYWSMTGTDVALFRLEKSYADLQRKGVRPFPLAPDAPEPGAAITVAARDESYRCTLARIVPTVMEVGLQTRDVLAYSPACATGPGTSGSPVLDENARVVGINNSSNRSGGRCVRDEPCEVDREGAISVSKGTGYAPPVRGLIGCLDRSEFDAARPGCDVPRP